ncbi:STE/STE20/MST protein kinase [Saprolegnia diclina VS20]|uniref:STE/STE20/MST protein kinase n=1 Tax=Saprolegnia diclina (strain VS20) TaxID=1156394 RepID=T0QM29_SAPDV|nr:STE/STE20/MST protein kinase [Saprolegnia diclina VS20]EQC34860.1 STE/STE20/MST protein kinase [Saprolegnia diclina VS20]|eukprot:XP_008611732.1 STE/STE20/MST protein kinase [Saprolegnia diclina VS20]
MGIEQVLATMGLSPGDPETIFDIHSREGAGAFGRVFRATCRSTQREVALKVIPIALKPGQHGEDVENVRREIEFLRECDHPNVVAFYDAYYKDGALWIAMEYCGGGSVGDISRQRRLVEQEISIILRGALHGLAHLHAKKKIHRDVKGGNILLTADGDVKIADFGVSAQLRDTLSRRGTFVGTPYWMSPEMIQDCDYDYKADIWSLGITAIELADQKPPLFEEHPMRVLIQIPRNPAPRLRQPHEWSSVFSDFLKYCLNKAPADRPSAIDCLAHPFITNWQDVARVLPDGLSPAAPTTTPTTKEALDKTGSVLDPSATPVQSQGEQAYVTCTQETMLPSVQSMPDGAALAADDAGAAATTTATLVTPSENFIGAPFEVAHDVCVKYNSYRAQYEGVPTHLIALHDQFGLPLDAMRCSSKLPNDLVPCLLHMLRRELLARNGASSKYIYRSSPDHGEIHAAKTALNAGRFDVKQHSDPFVLASLLKLWFRELPTPLLPSTLRPHLDRLAACATLDESNKRDASITAGRATVNECALGLLRALDAQTRSVLEWLLDHWLEIVLHTKTNLMTAHSLCIVWAPNLYRLDDATSPMEASKVSNLVALSLQVCLAWRDTHLSMRRANAGIASALAFSPPSTPTPRIAEPLFDVRTPLLSVLRRSVDDVLARVIDPIDEAALRQAQEVLWSVLRLHARSKSERDFADKLLKRSVAVTMPASLRDVARFVIMTLDLEAFQNAVTHHRSVTMTLHQLSERYPCLAKHTALPCFSNASI